MICNCFYCRLNYKTFSEGFFCGEPGDFCGIMTAQTCLQPLIIKPSPLSQHPLNSLWILVLNFAKKLWKWFKYLQCQKGRPYLTKSEWLTGENKVCYFWHFPRYWKSQTWRYIKGKKHQGIWRLSEAESDVDRYFYKACSSSTSSYESWTGSSSEFINYEDFLQSRNIPTNQMRRSTSCSPDRLPILLTLPKDFVVERRKHHMFAVLA